MESERTNETYHQVGSNQAFVLTGEFQPEVIIQRKPESQAINPTDYHMNDENNLNPLVQISQEDEQYVQFVFQNPTEFKIISPNNYEIQSRIESRDKSCIISDGKDVLNLKQNCFLEPHSTDCVTRKVMLDTNNDVQNQDFHQTNAANNNTYNLFQNNLESQSINEFICEICDKRFTSKSNLNGHILVHIGDKPYLCIICGKGFKRKEYVKAHISVHTKERPHVCSICNKGFTQKKSLKAHSSVHTKEKPHVCPICNKRLILKKYLKDHNLIHSKEKTHVCHICNKEFTGRKSLFYHNLSHHKEKQYACVICEKGFVFNTHLQRHILTHTKEKPHLCSICNKSFARKDNLKNHFALHTKSSNNV